MSGTKLVTQLNPYVNELKKSINENKDKSYFKTSFGSTEYIIINYDNKSHISSEASTKLSDTAFYEVTFKKTPPEIQLSEKPAHFIIENEKPHPAITVRDWLKNFNSEQENSNNSKSILALFSLLLAGITALGDIKQNIQGEILEETLYSETQKLAKFKDNFKKKCCLFLFFNDNLLNFTKACLKTLRDMYEDNLNKLNELCEGLNPIHLEDQQDQQDQLKRNNILDKEIFRPIHENLETNELDSQPAVKKIESYMNAVVSLKTALDNALDITHFQNTYIGITTFYKMNTLMQELEKNLADYTQPELIQKLYHAERLLSRPTNGFRFFGGAQKAAAYIAREKDFKKVREHLKAAGVNNLVDAKTVITAHPILNRSIFKSLKIKTHRETESTLFSSQYNY